MATMDYETENGRYEGKNTLHHSSYFAFSILLITSGY